MLDAGEDAGRKGQSRSVISSLSEFSALSHFLALVLVVRLAPDGGYPTRVSVRVRVYKICAAAKDGTQWTKTVATWGSTEIADFVQAIPRYSGYCEYFYFHPKNVSEH